MDLESKIKNRMRYYKTLKDKLEIHQTKVALISLRNQWLKNQKIANYQNEYDRIRGELSKSNLQGKTVEMLQKRKAKLEEMGAKAFDNIK
jgi:hypothetical protein